MPQKNPKVKFGLKNLAMLLSYFDYIFVHLRQKVHLRPKSNLKFLSTLDPNPTRKARPDLQLRSRLSYHIEAEHPFLGSVCESFISSGTTTGGLLDLNRK